MVSFDSYLSLPEGTYFRQTSQTFTTSPGSRWVSHLSPPPPGHLGFNMLTRLNWQVIHGRNNPLEIWEKHGKIAGTHGKIRKSRKFQLENPPNGWFSREDYHDQPMIRHVCWRTYHVACQSALRPRNQLAFHHDSLQVFLGFVTNFRLLVVNI